jgi:hypothetical protein
MLKTSKVLISIKNCNAIKFRCFADIFVRGQYAEE